MSDSLDVRLVGRLAGTLTNDAGRLGFIYDDRYRDDRTTPPLSMSMPKSKLEHGDDVAAPWIDNLLPDSDEVRQRWAAKFEIRRVDAFNLLRHTGEDCAGAVQIVPAGYQPTDDGSLEHIDDAQIEERLEALRQDDSDWTFAEPGGKWSLGGQQGKFALAQNADGEWMLPTGRAASTHIFKVGISRFAHGDAAEFVSMRAAHHLGILVADTQMRRFGDQTALIVGRFDRRIQDGAVVRRHQEDLCQALGLWRALKYQSDGGPSVRDVNGLLERDVDPRNLRRSRALLGRALVYNWLVAGTDAHAKNYALLHIGARTVLAPLYDLTSAALVDQPKTTHHKSQMAMKFGGAYRLSDIGTRQLLRTADDAGIRHEWFARTVVDYADRLPDAVARAIADAGDTIDDATAGQFHDRIESRLAMVRGTIDDLRGDESPSPQSGGSAADAAPTGRPDATTPAAPLARRPDPPARKRGDREVPAGGQFAARRHAEPDLVLQARDASDDDDGTDATSSSRSGT